MRRISRFCNLFGCGNLKSCHPELVSGSIFLCHARLDRASSGIIFHLILAIFVQVCYNSYIIGVSPSGKAHDFDSCIRRFKSCHPSQSFLKGRETEGQNEVQRSAKATEKVATKHESVCDWSLNKNLRPSNEILAEGQNKVQRSANFYGSLAQLVEHLTFNQGVPGSSPG